MALEVLVELAPPSLLVPAGKEAHRSKIDEIATENFGSSTLTIANDQIGTLLHMSVKSPGVARRDLSKDIL